MKRNTRCVAFALAIFGFADASLSNALAYYVPRHSHSDLMDAIAACRAQQKSGTSARACVQQRMR
jgi:hypothetical protein